MKSNSVINALKGDSRHAGADLGDDLAGGQDGDDAEDDGGGEGEAVGHGSDFLWGLDAICAGSLTSLAQGP